MSETKKPQSIPAPSKRPAVIVIKKGGVGKPPKGSTPPPVGPIPGGKSKG